VVTASRRSARTRWHQAADQREVASRRRTDGPCPESEDLSHILRQASGWTGSPSPDRPSERVPQSAGTVRTTDFGGLDLHAPRLVGAHPALGGEHVAEAGRAFDGLRVGR
jgi:hypothetical protein